jgi:hypothetical protein
MIGRDSTIALQMTPTNLRQITCLPGTEYDRYHEVRSYHATIFFSALSFIFPCKDPGIEAPDTLSKKRTALGSPQRGSPREGQRTILYFTCRAIEEDIIFYSSPFSLFSAHLFQAFSSEVFLPSCSPSQGLPSNINASLRINSVAESMLAKSTLHPNRIPGVPGLLASVQ